MKDKHAPSWPRAHAEEGRAATRADEGLPRRVLIVDDDASMRAALRRLMIGAGFVPELYESGTHFLDTADLDEPGCVLLDLQMPGKDGLTVQQELQNRHADIPLIFLTGSAEIRHAVAAMRAGAADFIEKPFENDDLLRRVQRVLEEYLRRRVTQQFTHEVAERISKLSPRESEVLVLIAKGLTNKEVANALGTSYRTVEIQRARIMERMQADSLADLVRMYLSVNG